MFGYVLASKDSLTQEQLSRYRACYCGLCRALKRRHGELPRLTLNFDMTFLVLLLTAMYEPEETAEEFRCLIHPTKTRCGFHSRFTDYAADLNVVLAYFNCLDDWKDGKNPVRLAEAKLLETACETAQRTWPRQCANLRACLDELSEIENGENAGPDAAADCFGKLMGELFVYYEDEWAGRFRVFGEALGRFIYMMDACVDLEKDKKHGQYNPFLSLGRESLTDPEIKAILEMLIGECAAEFEKLPIIQDAGILRNILYSGVWTQYELAGKGKGRAADDQRSV